MDKFSTNPEDSKGSLLSGWVTGDCQNAAAGPDQEDVVPCPVPRMLLQPQWSAQGPPIVRPPLARPNSAVTDTPMLRTSG